MKTTRRSTLKGLAGSLVWTGIAPGLSWATVDTDKRFLFIFLRGGMDGLSALPAYGDPLFQKTRGILADPNPGSGTAFDIRDLDGFFGLHRDLEAMQGLFRKGELLPIHAACHDYRDRSHFDAQDAFDRGSLDKAVKSGWLNRTLQVLPTELSTGRGDTAIGLGPTLTMSLRGEKSVGSWSPPMAPEADPDTIERLAALYATDKRLAPVLEKGLAAQAMSSSMGDNMMGMGDSQGFGNAIQFQEYIKAAATFLNADEGPRVVTIDYGNWDSHANQNQQTVRGPNNGSYGGQFAEMYLGLDRGIAALKAQMNTAAWAQTAVFMVTEFGRTVHVNGTNGTDHGTAGAAFLLGGAVKGGRVHADWPGLKTAQLRDERDLMPTTDLRAVAKGILLEHMGVSEAALEVVFPRSSEIKPVTGLIRT
ncbi:MAG: DUF1501 domain-containing protein [bacterium]